MLFDLKLLEEAKEEEILQLEEAGDGEETADAGRVVEAGDAQVIGSENLDGDNQNVAEAMEFGNDAGGAAQDGRSMRSRLPTIKE